MKLIKGKLIIKNRGDKDIQLFTGNSYIKHSGELVMGRGIAKYVRDTFPKVASAIGSQIPHLGVYGLKFTNVTGFWIGVFQVKYNFSDKADLGLVKYSVKSLTKVAKDNPELTFHINYPAIGNGKQAIENIQPIIEDLPNNVLVYKII